MKFSENWLREFVNPDIDTNTLTHQLTMAGLEVDGFESAYSDISGVVVAEVKSVKKHPDADKLKVCEVDYGENDLLTIVCGADNVKQGIYTFLAKVGAKLPGIPTLEVATLKGIESHGMLCSPIELGLGDDSDGIVELSDDEPIGSPFNEIFKTDDKIIEISLTPNRGDCLSIKGIAQEVAVINQLTVTKNEITPVKVTSDNTRAVKLSADEACPRYVGRVIENVNVNVPSPLWLTEKLRCSGIRSINVIVDITNFVMLEMGQPMHAFDNDILRGEINVRIAKPGEKIKLLDESEHEIKPDTLLITDDSNALAMAGLMGGYGSAVNFDTKNVFLESAFFKPEVIIGEARQYGLHTDSSHRFERGVDPELQAIAIERASGLILELCGGHAGPVIDIKSEKNLPKNPEVILRKSQIKRVLGIELDEDFVTETFQKLNMNCKYDVNQWIIEPSSSRFDINIEVDLIEELTRIYGYDAIPVASPNHNLKIKPENKKQQIIDQIREILVNRDFQEIITYSFVEPGLNKPLINKDNKMVLANPIAAELSEMRTSLWPGLLATLEYNTKRQVDRVRLFETGMVFNGNEDLEQDYHVGGIIYGNILEKQWNMVNNLSDLYNLKADIEAILSALVGENAYEFRPCDVDLLHPGQALEIAIEGHVSGWFGQLHPRIQSLLDLGSNVYLFDIKTENLVRDSMISYQSISRFPSIKRDISILVDESIAYAEVKSCIGKDATELLNNLELFDVYQGEGIEKGKKSLALGLTFQATSSTLKDEEVETIMGNIIDGLHNKFGAKLRE